MAARRRLSKIQLGEGATPAVPGDAPFLQLDVESVYQITFNVSGTVPTSWSALLVGRNAGAANYWTLFGGAFGSADADLTTADGTTALRKDFLFKDLQVPSSVLGVSGFVVTGGTGVKTLTIHILG